MTWFNTTLSTNWYLPLFYEHCSILPHSSANKILNCNMGKIGSDNIPNTLSSSTVILVSSCNNI